MIFYLAIGREAYTITDYLDDRGAKWRGQIAVIPYESLSRADSLPVGTYIFSDLDRITHAQRLLAQNLFEALLKSQSDMLLLNQPNKFVGRFDLMRSLYEQGINDFNVYRPHEVPHDVRFPVFLRYERDHLGARSALLYSQEELDQAIADAMWQGAWFSNLMVIEFCETKDESGIYRKYSVWRIGKHFAPGHQIIGNQWMLKAPTVAKGESWPREWVMEEQRFIESNPHLAQVRRVFDQAGIDYGRMDYGMKDGRVQIWEINTNPTTMRPRNEQLPERRYLDDMIAEQLDIGWRSINCPKAPFPQIPVNLDYRRLNEHPSETWLTG